MYVYDSLQVVAEAKLWKESDPSYRFDKARVIVSLGADFLGTWLVRRVCPAVCYRQKINEKNPE
jgi:molybdopterin-containing oxidoreductase family iron-sulfur binding subunit